MNRADITLAHHVASEVACLFLLNEEMYILLLRKTFQVLMFCYQASCHEIQLAIWIWPQNYIQNPGLIIF